MSEPIRMTCEGSGTPNVGYCQMCARVFPEDTIPEHERDDVLAMLDRGDYDDATPARMR